MDSICIYKSSELTQAPNKSGSYLVSRSSANNSISNSDENINSELTSKFQRKSSTEFDKEYLSAVESGDMETAQRLVDEAAKKAGYAVKAYHGTEKDFTVFEYGHDRKTVSESMARCSLAHLSA